MNYSTHEICTNLLAWDGCKIEGLRHDWENVVNSLDVNMKDDYGYTLLNGTIIYHRAEYPQLIKKLLEMGTDVNIADNLGRTPMMNLSFTKYKNNLIPIFLDYGASKDIVDYRNMTVFSYACTDSYNIELIKLLYSPQIDINMPDVEGNTPLHHKIKSALILPHNDDIDIVEFLLNCGANPNSENCRGETPYSLACRYHFPSIKNMLELANLSNNFSDTLNI